MTPTPAPPAVLLASKFTSALVAALASRFETFGPSIRPFSEAVAELPRADAERIRGIVTMGTVGATRAAMDGTRRDER